MKRNIVLFSLCLGCSLSISSLSAQSDYPYKNPKLPVEQRVNDLLGRMTLEEKVAQLNMKSLNKLKLEKSGQVSDSSLVALFGGESIGCLESPFIEHEKVAAYSEAADHTCGQRPGWASLPSRLPSACTGTWRWEPPSSPSQSA